MKRVAIFPVHCRVLSAACNTVDFMTDLPASGRQQALSRFPGPMAFLILRRGRVRPQGLNLHSLAGS